MKEHLKVRAVGRYVLHGFQIVDNACNCLFLQELAQIFQLVFLGLKVFVGYHKLDVGL